MAKVIDSTIICLNTIAIIRLYLVSFIYLLNFLSHLASTKNKQGTTDTTTDKATTAPTTKKKRPLFTATSDVPSVTEGHLAVIIVVAAWMIGL